MQAPGGSDEDKEGGFKHGGWQGPYFDEVEGAAVDEAYRSSGGMILGRVTYEIFAAYWPNPPDPEGAEYADMMNKPPKYVASKTLKAPLEWENSHLLEGDLAEAVKKLKEEDGGDLQVVGSSKSPTRSPRPAWSTSGSSSSTPSSWGPASACSPTPARKSPCS